MNLALFDFDGTITTKDSLEEFIIFAVGKQKYRMGLLVLSPILAGYVLKLVPNYIAKEIMLSYFFKGWSEIKFKEVAKEYSLNEIDKITRPEAIEKIKAHQKGADRVVIVSASIRDWLEPWCERMHIELISSELEVKDGLLTGKFKGKNCHGIEKANRINSSFYLSGFKKIFAYGDSKGDKEMLAIADERFYQPFRD